MRTAFLAATSLIALLLFFQTSESTFPAASNTGLWPTNAKLPSIQHDWSTFETQPIAGFTTRGRPIGVTCNSLYVNGTIGVQNGTAIHDDMVAIALSQDNHPMVKYPENLSPHAPGANFSDVVQKTWYRMSGSSAWLEQYGVFITVTRVIFTPSGNPQWCTINFLRTQIYDENWNHLSNYTLKWGDYQLTFPLVYDVGAQWKPGGSWFGPEDPRIVIEEDAHEPEPVVVFNMVTNETDWRRSMWIFRPFSQFGTVLTIRGQERGGIEKNWAPFFHNAGPPDSKGIKAPSKHLHLVYAYYPLRVIYCDLLTGGCDMAYSQEALHDGWKTKHGGNQNDLKGGTNLIALPLKNVSLKQPVRAWVGLPRTHIDNCWGAAVYRPMFTILLNIGSQYFLTFASTSMDFGHAVLGAAKDGDPCDTGRIMISNSIARWDRRTGPGQRDVMTLTLSLDDRTVQVVHVADLLPFFQSLPFTADLLNQTDLSSSSENFLRNTEISALGNDVQHCAVEAAWNYTVAATEIHSAMHKEEAAERHRKELEEQAKKLEAEKQKADEEARAKDADQQAKMKAETEEAAKKKAEDDALVAQAEQAKGETAKEAPPKLEPQKQEQAKA